jgi:hypothetical protein
MENSNTSRLRVFRWYEKIGSKTDALGAMVAWVVFSRGVDTILIKRKRKTYDIVAQSCCAAGKRETRLMLMVDGVQECDTGKEEAQSSVE